MRINSQKIKTTWIGPSGANKTSSGLLAQRSHIRQVKRKLAVACGHQLILWLCHIPRMFSWIGIWRVWRLEQSSGLIFHKQCYKRYCICSRAHYSAAGAQSNMYNGFNCTAVHTNVLFVCLVIKGIIMNWKSRKDVLHIISIAACAKFGYGGVAYRRQWMHL